MAMRADKRMLLDRWSTSGNDLNQLYEILEHIGNSTKIEQTRTDNLVIFSTINFDGILKGYKHSQTGSANVGYTYEELTGKHHATQDMIDEAVSSSRVMFELGNNVFFSSVWSLNTLGQRCGDLLGEYPKIPEADIRFARDLSYVRYAKHYPKYTKVVYREEDGLKKIFAFFSDRYGAINQEEITKGLISAFEKEMGTVKLVRYEITNFYTDMHFEFPEKAEDFKLTYGLKQDVVPGIRIRMSDVGEVSFSAQGTVRIGKSTISVPKALKERKHTKNAKVDEIIEECCKKVFPEYTKAPERCLELMLIDIKAPIEAVKKIGESSEFAECCTSAKVRKELINEIVDGIDPTLSFTAFDIVSLFLDRQENFENTVKPGYRDLVKMRNAFSSVMFFPFEKYNL